ncbi:hypothetical protein [Streptomyces sp. NPDC020681]|uniref:hypothetical protein n=1 Tax=Streptomyces sp. NPDC020681 TaxID=3365083 RepID=UPI003787DED6
MADQSPGLRFVALEPFGTRSTACVKLTPPSPSLRGSSRHSPTTCRKPTLSLADPPDAYAALQRSHDTALGCLREHLEMSVGDTEILLRDTMDDERTAMLDHMAGE